VKEGDAVLFTKYGDTEVKLDGEDYLVIRESNLLAIVTTDGLLPGARDACLPRNCSSRLRRATNWKTGIDIQANAIKVTLGPRGRTTAIDRKWGRGPLSTAGDAYLHVLCLVRCSTVD